jgi:isoprenylcysteine carboxyl methyltransferase (ICMT) family protein YpbQ
LNPRSVRMIYSLIFRRKWLEHRNYEVQIIIQHFNLYILLCASCVLVLVNHLRKKL